MWISSAALDAGDAGKLREIEALVGSPAVAAQLDGVMGCGADIRA